MTCSGYRRKPGQTADTVHGECTHGFLVTGPCVNDKLADLVVPMCCMADIPKHWQSLLDDSGKPKQKT